MSILSVANVHFDTDGSNRMEYLAANGFLNLVTTGNIAISSRNFTLTAVGASGNVLTSNGTTWISQAPTVTASPGTSGNVLTSSGTAWISSTPTINLRSQVTSTLQVANGGTGLVSVGTSGNMLVSNGTAFVSSNNAVSPNFTGTIYLDGSSRANVINVTANTIDCSLGNYFIKTVSGALSWTFSNAPASRSYIFALELTNGGSGTQTWPVAVVWNGGTAPTLQTSGVDVLVFLTDDGGTIWRGVRGWKQA